VVHGYVCASPPPSTLPYFCTSIMTAFMLGNRHSIPDRSRRLIGEHRHLGCNAFQYRDIQVFQRKI
jgi:hypothetical protein